jgi:hypothetical protein
MIQRLAVLAAAWLLLVANCPAQTNTSDQNLEAVQEAVGYSAVQLNATEVQE